MLYYDRFYARCVQTHYTRDMLLYDDGDNFVILCLCPPYGACCAYIICVRLRRRRGNKGEKNDSPSGFDSLGGREDLNAHIWGGNPLPPPPLFP